MIYDQSGHGNNLTQAPGGGAAGGPDNLANATAAPVTAGGHKAYGVYVAAGTGYRNNSTNGIATGDSPEGKYAIFDGTHYNGGCCFDYGNAETSNNDTGNGHMEAIYFGNIKVWGYGTGNGPWVMADLENGLFSGVNAGYNANDPTITDRFTTAIMRAAQPVGDPGRQCAVRWPVHLLQRAAPQRVRLQPDAQGRRDHPRHRRRQQQGFRRHLLRGRDDLRLPVGRDRERGPGQHRLGRLHHVHRRHRSHWPIVAGVNSADCVDLANASATDGNHVQLYTCNGVAAAQSWTVNSNGTLTIDGGCMDITGANYSNGTKIEWWTCNDGANQQWTAVNGALENPASGKCLDDPGSSTTLGTQLQLYTCNGGSNQKWTLP